MVINMSCLIKKINALTIMELIVSTMVVGIIMMGVASSDYAIRKQTDLSYNGAQASLKVQGILNHIMNSAFYAIGTAGVDEGIVVGPSGAVANNSFCIRTSKAPDNWVCYTNVAAHLYTCTAAAPANCASTDQDLGEVYKNSYSLNNVNDAIALPFGKNGSVRVLFEKSNTPPNQRILFTATVSVPDSSNSTTGKSTSSNSVSPTQYTF